MEGSGRSAKETQDSGRQKVLGCMLLAVIPASVVIYYATHRRTGCKNRGRLAGFSPGTYNVYYFTLYPGYRKNREAADGAKVAGLATAFGIEWRPVKNDFQFILSGWHRPEYGSTGVVQIWFVIKKLAGCHGKEDIMRSGMG
jgi:hypothetical protein